MIVTRTPFRVTLGGGGTDLPSFYEQHGGFVLAMAIDKFMYVVLNIPNADRLVRLHYTNSETTASVEELQHELAREAFRLHGIHDAVEVASVADVGAGSGLGSSSCYLVGLLTAVRAYLRRPVPLQEVAEEACHIELEILRKPIGKQDQYMATFGGLTALEIARDGTVDVSTIHLEPTSIATLLANTHLYYTNVQRSAPDVLADQNQAMRETSTPDRQRVEASLLGIKEIGYQIRDAIVSGDFDRFGTLMDDHWQLKRQMSNKISISAVDELYDYVKQAYGVLGGKVVGAGGGGFLMLYCPQKHRELTQFMRSRGMMRLHYNAEFEGAKVVTNLFNAHSLAIHGQGVL
ncbi:MAG TPA: galactokinase [Chloroflexota bacterium]|nr:galactokinase [Chloroflexota bacterium]